MGNSVAPMGNCAVERGRNEVKEDEVYEQEKLTKVAATNRQKENISTIGEQYSHSNRTYCCGRGKQPF